MSVPSQVSGSPGRANPAANTRGGSLVEAMVGIVVLAVTLLSLASGAALGLRQTSRGRAEMQQWAAIQSVVDSLVAIGADSAGWANAAAGSGTVNGYPVSWSVTAGNPKRIDLVLQRLSAGSLQLADTLVFYVARPW